MARVEVPMPQMGESIAEGTVSTWLKKAGDEVERDEPILEISTDKVDAEIPAPAAGTLASVEVEEGETVEVGTIVAYIETEKGAATAAEPEAAPAPEAAEEEAAPEQAAAPPAEAEKAPAAGNGKPEPAAAPAAGGAPVGGDGAGAQTREERLRQRSTPLVRRIAAEHDVDLTSVSGTGYAGRVTKQDIMAFIEGGGAEAPAAAPTAPGAAPPMPREPVPAGGAMSADQLWDLFYGQVRHPEWPIRESDRVEPMNRIRELTAQHMVLAKRTAPHVHSFIEIDFTRIDRIRSQNKPRWKEQGVSVSFTAFVVWACAKLLQEHERVNGTVSGENLVFRGDINVGMAVDLNPGLIVPVIKNADELNLVGIGKRIVDLATRARDRKLKPDEIQGATFSITNPGVLGTTVGMPIIPEGTSAILGTGAIEKKPVVIEHDGTDTIAVRKRAMFSMGYDHRIVDGADAARFLADLKETLETFPENVA